MLAQAKSTKYFPISRIVTCFVIIYLLNCIDLLFTYTYLQTGQFYEANPIMAPIIENPYLALSIKIIMPGIFIIYALRHLDEIPNKSFPFVFHMLLAVLFGYTIINGLHLIYFLQLLPII